MVSSLIPLVVVCPKPTIEHARSVCDGGPPASNLIKLPKLSLKVLLNRPSLGPTW